MVEGEGRRRRAARSLRVLVENLSGISDTAQRSDVDVLSVWLLLLGLRLRQGRRCRLLRRDLYKTSWSRYSCSSLGEVLAGILTSDLNEGRGVLWGRVERQSVCLLLLLKFACVGQSHFVRARKNTE